MPTDFLHGAEFIEVEYGYRQIKTSRSSIIGLVGLAGKGPVNVPTLITNYVEAVTTFGAYDGSEHKTGYTIPRALREIFDQGNRSAMVAVINVFDPDDHVSGVPEAPDPTVVTVADIVGGVDPDTGKRSGIEALLDIQGIYGFRPRILITPEWSHETEVITALKTIAGKLRAIALVDIEDGTTKDDALTFAETNGGDRIFLLYPYVSRTYSESTSPILRPQSPIWAGVISRTDNTMGWWWSPSNKDVYGVEGQEFPIDFGISDTDSWANLLNEANINTIINAQGWRTWGNRLDAVDTKFAFLPVRRTFDIVIDSLEIAALQFVDRPINKAFFEDVVNAEQAFLNDLRGRGAIIHGRVWFIPEENTPEQIASGNVSFNIEITPTYPAERITHKVILDIGQLATIFE